MGWARWGERDRTSPLRSNSKRGKEATSLSTLRTQEEPNSMPPPPTPPCLAPPQLVCVRGGGHDLHFTPQIPKHLPPPLPSRTKLCRRRCLDLAYFYAPPPPPPAPRRAPGPSPPSPRSAPGAETPGNASSPTPGSPGPCARPCLQGSPGDASGGRGPRSGLRGSHVVAAAAWASSPASRELGQPPVSGP